MILRPARVEEAGKLSALALRSKAYWGYDKKFLAACKRELTISENKIRELSVLVYEENGTAAGFYALEPTENDSIELTFLFVEPEWVGRGVGTQLFEHACRRARERKAHTLVIHGDPNATPFYFARGAVQAGTVPSGSIPGRLLPLFKLDLTRENPSIRIVDLKQKPEAIDTMVGWFAGEWPEYAQRRTEQGIQVDFEQALSEEPLPRVWLAVADGSPIGTVALRKSSVQSHRERSPWLAGLYVTPAMRQNGIGNYLVTTLVGAALQNGYTEIHAGIRKRGRLFPEIQWPQVEELELQRESILVVRYRHPSP